MRPFLHLSIFLFSTFFRHTLNCFHWRNSLNTPICTPVEMCVCACVRSCSFYCTSGLRRSCCSGERSVAIHVIEEKWMRRSTHFAQFVELAVLVFEALHRREVGLVADAAARHALQRDGRVVALQDIHVRDNSAHSANGTLNTVLSRITLEHRFGCRRTHLR